MIPPEALPAIFSMERTGTAVFPASNRCTICAAVPEWVPVINSFHLQALVHFLII
jgi:Asp-tRNA(Asn)/Glu-tRNA(Gln) amidotransferase B subunit